MIWLEYVKAVKVFRKTFLIVLMGFVTLNVGDPLLLGHNDILFLHLAQIHDAHAGTRSVITGCTVMLGTNICSEPCEPYS